MEQNGSAVAPPTNPASTPGTRQFQLQQFAALRKQLCERYEELIGRIMDSKSCAYWCNLLHNRSRTFQDFEKTLVHSAEYEKRLLTLFKGACQELIGADAFDARLFDEFMRENKGTVTPLDNIYGFVRHTKQYAKKHRDLVRSIAYLTVEREDLSNDEVDAYVGKFQNAPGYTVESLKHDLLTQQGSSSSCSRPQPCSSAAHASSSDPKKTTTTPAKNDSDAGNDPRHLETTDLFNGGDQKAQPMRTPAQARQEMVDASAMLSEFHRIFGRPMYVQEYIRYMSCDRVPNAELFEQERPIIHGLVNVVSDVYIQYLGVRVGEYEVVSRYLMTFYQAESGGKQKSTTTSVKSPEEVQEAVTKEVVQTDGYRSAMHKKIAQEYATMFSSDLTEADVDHVFVSVKSHGISLIDDRLRECIVDFKNQTDMIVNNLYDVYMAVYERTPDTEELAEQVKMYRANDPKEENMPRLNRSVECKLVSSLEFQDVLKARIKQRYVETREDSMSSAALYATLEKALDKLRALPHAERTMETMDAVVKSLVA